MTVATTTKPPLRTKPKLSVGQLDQLEKQRKSLGLISERERQERQDKLNRLTLLYNSKQVNPVPGAAAKPVVSPVIVAEDRDPLLETVLKGRVRPNKDSLLSRVHRTVDRSWRQSVEQWQERTMDMPSLALALGFMQRLG